MKLALGILPTTEVTLKHVGEGNDPSEQYILPLFIHLEEDMAKVQISTDLWINRVQ